MTCRTERPDILQVDGYAGYNRLTLPGRKGGVPIQLAYCWAHSRRKLREIYDSSGSEIAAEGLLRRGNQPETSASIRMRRRKAAARNAGRA